MANNAPTEVLENICQHLSFADLKQARFLCRSFNPAARHYLFREILVHCDLESYRKLSYISRQPDLARWVQKLHLNDKLVAATTPVSEVAHMEFKEWSAQVLKERMPIASGSNQYRESLLPVELQWHYSQYRYQIESEKRILTGNLAFDWLSDACKSLRNLAVISFGLDRGQHSGGKESPARPAPGLRHENLSVLAQRTLTDRKNDIDRERKAKMIIALIEAAKVGRGGSKTVNIIGLPMETFEEIRPCLHEPDRMISKVRHLRLYVVVEYRDDEVFENFARFLANAMMLQTLHLTFRNQPVGRIERGLHSCYSLSKIRMYREHWPSLRDVKLARMVTTEKALTDLLETHAATLQSFELCDIEILPPASASPPPGFAHLPSPTQPPSITADDHPGSWLTIINLLAQSLRLKHISFNGFLISPTDTWVVRDEDQYYLDQHLSDSMAFEPYPERPLRDRIHNYILDPKRPVMQSTEDSLARLVDASWGKQYRDAEGVVRTDP